MGEDGGRSLAETPTWAVATVVSFMVAFGFFFHGSLKEFAKWLDITKRKALLAALEKIREELMLFGLLSLLLGHWTVFVAKICIKSPPLSSRFYLCLPETDLEDLASLNHIRTSSFGYLNYSVVQEQNDNRNSNFCPEGHESYASYESLVQLHRFLFVLGVVHVSYSFAAIALAMVKIYSWRKWEKQAKLSLQKLEGLQQCASNNIGLRGLSTSIFHHTSHLWSQHRVLVWLLCFGRQFWSSINRDDYKALRLGFITTHQLPLSYDFHDYVLQSMEEEFRDIVGISVPLWIFAVLCIFLDFHGTNFYFWISFLPAMLILVIGTKLQSIVIKLAVEIMGRCPWTRVRQFNLRDELFWFGNPKFLLRLIQFISFQNTLEMAMFVWSLWESSGSSCFMGNHSFIIIRLTFGLASQFWCSFITFPLYVIITQMGPRFNKSINSESTVKNSVDGWQRRVKARHNGPSFTLLTATTSTTASGSALQDQSCEISPTDEKLVLYLDLGFVEGPGKLKGKKRRKKRK
ncbi:hypothetical protein NMG60_11026318 [Bertholletia excelsa]